MRYNNNFYRTHYKVVDNIVKDIENNAVTWEEGLLLMTNRQEWRSWIAQCATHGMD